MKVRCEVYGLEIYTGPLIVKSKDSLGDRIHIEIDGKEIDVHGRELMKAIENCMND